MIKTDTFSQNRKKQPTEDSRNKAPPHTHTHKGTNKIPVEADERVQRQQRIAETDIDHDGNKENVIWNIPTGIAERRYVEIQDKEGRREASIT